MNKKEILKRIYRYLRKYKRAVAVSLLLSFVTVILTLLVPLLVGRAIDSLGTGSGAQLIRSLVLVACAAVISALCQWGMSTVNNKITCGVVRDIRADAFEKLQKLPFSYLDSTSAGDTLSRIMTDADSFSDGLLLGFTQLFSGVMTILGTVLFMLYLNPLVTAVVVVLTPLSMIVSRLIANGSYKLFRKQAEERAELTSFTEEMVVGRNVVRAYGMEDRVGRTFEEKNERLRKTSGKAVFYSSLTNPTTRFLNSLVYAAVAFTGALLLLKGQGGMSIGGLSSFLAYANQYTKPFNEISGVIAELQNAFACIGRIFELFDEQEELPDRENAAVLLAKGNVGAENVDFSYHPERKLIENFNLTVTPGQRIAIVGPTGCGKTTLINLLMRFYDPQKGKMTLEGKDLRDYRRRDVRLAYGMVLQENWIGHATVADNIRRGMPEAEDAQVVAAAKAAHAHDFIVRLPDGYNTMLKENGDGLSAGQKQLICIAAVMLCQPPMLILDEATSSIDTRTELKIQDAFARLMEGRTSFIVAHRLSTVKDADRILVMRDGHIVESGTHQTLLDKGGFYSQLYNAQFS